MHNTSSLVEMAKHEILKRFKRFGHTGERIAEALCQFQPVELAATPNDICALMEIASNEDFATNIYFKHLGSKLLNQRFVEDVLMEADDLVLEASLSILCRGRVTRAKHQHHIFCRRLSPRHYEVKSFECWDFIMKFEVDFENWCVTSIDGRWGIAALDSEIYPLSSCGSSISVTVKPAKFEGFLKTNWEGKLATVRIDDRNNKDMWLECDVN